MARIIERGAAIARVVLDDGCTSRYKGTDMGDTTDHLDTLPRRLEYARKAAGLNRSALAVAAGLNPSHVRLIEEGEREDPTGTTLAKLADALGVSLDWLVRGIGDAPAAPEATDLAATGS